MYKQQISQIFGTFDTFNHPKLRGHDPWELLTQFKTLNTRHNAKIIINHFSILFLVLLSQRRLLFFLLQEWLLFNNELTFPIQTWGNLQQATSWHQREPYFQAKFAKVGEATKEIFQSSQLCLQKQNQEVERTVVHCKDVEGFVWHVLEARCYSAPETLLKISIDTGRGFFKICLQVINFTEDLQKHENHHSRKKNFKQVPKKFSFFQLFKTCLQATQTFFNSLTF